MTKTRTMTAAEAVSLIQRTILRNPEQFHTLEYRREPLSDHIRQAALAAHPDKGRFTPVMFNRDRAVFRAKGTVLRVDFGRGWQRLEVYENEILVDRVRSYEDMVSVQVWLADRYGVVLEFPIWLEKEICWAREKGDGTKH
jgi:hypothetical protein